MFPTACSRVIPERFLQVSVWDDNFGSGKNVSSVSFCKDNLEVGNRAPTAGGGQAERKRAQANAGELKGSGPGAFRNPGSVAAEFR